MIKQISRRARFQMAQSWARQFRNEEHRVIAVAAFMAGARWMCAESLSIESSEIEPGQTIHE